MVVTDDDEVKRFLVRGVQDFSGVFEVNISAITTNVATGDVTTNTSTVEISVAPVADTPFLSLVDPLAVSLENDLLRYVVHVEPADVDGSESLNLTVSLDLAPGNVGLFQTMLYNDKEYTPKRVTTMLQTTGETSATVETVTSDFESGAAADGWTTSTFSVLAGSTGSSSTGPQAASSGSYYMYAETSSPNNPYAVFEMYQEFDGAVSTVDFDYHMYGATMGTAEVQGSADGSSYTTLWTRSGDQGSAWSSAAVDASGGSYTWLRFKYTGGASYTGDFALDAIVVVTASTSTSASHVQQDISLLFTEFDWYVPQYVYVNAWHRVEAQYLRSDIEFYTNSHDEHYHSVYNYLEILVSTTQSVIEPPNLLGAKFSGQGDSVTFSFDTASNRGGYTGSFDCAAAFPQRFLDGLGSGYYCSWITDKALKLTFGSYATIMPGESMTIAEGWLSASSADGVPGQLYGKHMPTDLMPPDNGGVIPELVLIAPLTVGRCDDITMDASGTTGSGGRTVNYRWKLAGIRGGPAQDAANEDAGGDNATAAIECFTVTMSDSYGDGWNGARYTWSSDDSGVMLKSGTLNSGSSATEEVCTDGTSTCYTMYVSSGSYPTEVTWSMAAFLTQNMPA
jgi:hypothetical protein